MKRQADTLTVETDEGGTLTRFDAVELSCSLDGASEAMITIGGEKTYAAIRERCAIGKNVKIWVNNRLRMSGRFEGHEPVASPRGGTSVALTIRTKMADTRYSSADPNVKVEKTSIKDFIVALHAPFGYQESDFQFAEAAARDLMTGKASAAKDPVDLEPIKLDQAKVNPPETVYACTQRHLKRHHLMHWDAPDGRIVIGAPDDQQAALYTLRRQLGNPGNNLAGIGHTRSYSELASEVWVYGQMGGRKDIARASVKGSAIDQDLIDIFDQGSGHFYRPVTIPTESCKTVEQAMAQAQRELSARQRNKNAINLPVDAWSFWTGSESIPYAINTTADVIDDTVDGKTGLYLVHSVNLRWDAASGSSGTLGLVKSGIWVI